MNKTILFQNSSLDQKNVYWQEMIRIVFYTVWFHKVIRPLIPHSLVLIYQKNNLSYFIKNPVWIRKIKFGWENSIGLNHLDQSLSQRFRCRSHGFKPILMNGKEFYKTLLLNSLTLIQFKLTTFVWNVHPILYVYLIVWYNQYPMMINKMLLTDWWGVYGDIIPYQEETMSHPESLTVWSRAYINISIITNPFRGNAVVRYVLLSIPRFPFTAVYLTSHIE